jgi:hypothetical protein
MPSRLDPFSSQAFKIELCCDSIEIDRSNLRRASEADNSGLRTSVDAGTKHSEIRDVCQGFARDNEAGGTPPPLAQSKVGKTCNIGARRERTHLAVVDLRFAR